MSWYEERFVERLTRLRVECSECTRSYWLPASKAELYVTCGADCSDLRRARLREQRRRDCVTCGSEFFPRQTQIEAGNGKFCSQKCNTTSHGAMNSPAAQLVARTSWRRTFDARPFIFAGVKNPGWKGGPRAAYQRQLDSGARRATANRRRLRGGERIPADMVQTLGRQQRWRCTACHKNLRTAGFHLDHVMPLALGGTNAKANLQLLCVKCNRTKHAKHPIDFMQTMGYLL